LAEDGEEERFAVDVGEENRGEEVPGFAGAAGADHPGVGAGDGVEVEWDWA